MNSANAIQTQDLRKTYRIGQVDVPALRGVDLIVKQGEFLSIVGPSGSGKSTLFHIIGALTPPTSGEVEVAGQNLAAMTDADRTRLRKRTVGFVFQKFNLLPNLTARDNIAVAKFISGHNGAPDPHFEEILQQFRTATFEAIRRHTEVIDDVVGDQAMPAGDQLERKFALADSGIALDQHAEALYFDEHAMPAH